MRLFWWVLFGSVLFYLNRVEHDKSVVEDLRLDVLVDGHIAVKGGCHVDVQQPILKASDDCLETSITLKPSISKRMLFLLSLGLF